eukprot:Opistho-1_new@83043
MEPKKKKGNIGIIAAILIVATGVFVYNKFFRAKPNEYIAFYNTVRGLQSSSPVMVKGVRVGKIKDVQIQPDGLVKVTLLLKGDMQLPDSTKAYLASSGLLGDKVIALVFSNSKNYMERGDTLISELGKDDAVVSAKVEPITETVHYLLYSADTTLRGINVLLQHGLSTKFIMPLKSFEKSIKKYEGISADLNKDNSITNGIASAGKSSGELAAKSNDWKKSLQSIQQSTRELADKNMQQQLKDIGGNVKKLSASVNDLSKETGSINKMATDKSTYTNAAKQLDTINSSMKELKDNPPGFSIFGKSKKKK